MVSGPCTSSALRKNAGRYPLVLAAYSGRARESCRSRALSTQWPHTRKTRGLRANRKSNTKGESQHAQDACPPSSFHIDP
jgi:hypothetical protein